MPEVAVKLENISKFYKLYDSPKDRLKEARHPYGKKFHHDFYALKNIDLEIKRGEILGIVGRNGAGKSTLLKLICSVIRPSSGNIKVNGNVSALLELSAGLDPEFSGIQNIYFSGTMMGFSRKEMKDKIDEIISFADIGDFINQPLKTYSSGMKTRLGFALAININPDILILDEVLAVGDDLFKRKCYTKMEELFRSNCTTLYVSHSMSNINQICSRAILLDRGELILEGHPKLVTTYYQKYLFVKPEEAEKTRAEILQLNHNDQKKAQFAQDLLKLKEHSKEKSNVQNDEQTQEPDSYFIPNFNPQSTVITKNYNVDIFDIHIRNLNGKRVNVLIMNNEYIYSFKVKFDIDAVQVGVGVPFKTEKGLLITNYTLYGDFIPEVKKGEQLSIDCRFKCIFLPGVYYATAEVGSIIDGDRVVLNRIVDALAFKVETKDKKTKWGGLVYCNQHFDIKID